MPEAEVTATGRQTRKILAGYFFYIDGENLSIILDSGSFILHSKSFSTFVIPAT
jgi:hypothetical protein